MNHMLVHLMRGDKICLKNVVPDSCSLAIRKCKYKRSLQRPLNNQILNYESMLELCENEMSSIKFFGISKESMTNITANLEMRYKNGGHKK